MCVGAKLRSPSEQLTQRFLRRLSNDEGRTEKKNNVFMAHEQIKTSVDPEEPMDLPKVVIMTQVSFLVSVNIFQCHKSVRREVTVSLEPSTSTEMMYWLPDQW